jgi:hypothetical protein
VDRSPHHDSQFPAAHRDAHDRPGNRYTDCHVHSDRHRDRYTDSHIHTDRYPDFDAHRDSHSHTDEYPVKREPPCLPL